MKKNEIEKYYSMKIYTTVIECFILIVSTKNHLVHWLKCCRWVKIRLHSGLISFIYCILDLHKNTL